MLWRIVLTSKKSDIEALKEKAAHDDVEAQLLLGDMYYKGEGIKKDLSKAADYYRQAAEVDDRFNERLARVYWELSGTSIRFEDANRYLRKADMKIPHNVMKDIRIYHMNDGKFPGTVLSSILFRLISLNLSQYIHLFEQVLAQEEDPNLRELCPNKEYVSVMAYQYMATQTINMIHFPYDHGNMYSDYVANLEIFHPNEKNEMQGIFFYLLFYHRDWKISIKTLKLILTAFNKAAIDKNVVSLSEKLENAIKKRTSELGYVEYSKQKISWYLEHLEKNEIIQQEGITYFHALQSSGELNNLYMEFIRMGTDYSTSMLDLFDRVDKLTGANVSLSMKLSEYMEIATNSISRAVNFHSCIIDKDSLLNGVSIMLCISKPKSIRKDQIDDMVDIDKADIDGFYINYNDHKDYKSKDIFKKRIGKKHRNLMVQLAYFSARDDNSKLAKMLPPKIDDTCSRLNTMFRELFAPYLNDTATPFLDTTGFKVRVTLDHPEYIEV